MSNQNNLEPDILFPFLYGLNLETHRSGRVTEHLVLTVGGLVITGKLAPASSVIRDAALDIKLSEDVANAIASKAGERETLQILSLIDVRILGAHTHYDLPFLRVRMTSVDSWSLVPPSDSEPTNLY
jgi:hypothetical protein